MVSSAVRKRFPSGDPLPNMSARQRDCVEKGIQDLREAAVVQMVHSTGMQPGEPNALGKLT